jgi:hypothetical protein
VGTDGVGILAALTCFPRKIGYLVDEFFQFIEIVRHIVEVDDTFVISVYVKSVTEIVVSSSQVTVQIPASKIASASVSIREILLCAPLF